MSLSPVPLAAVLALLAVHLPHAVALSVVDLREHRLPNPLVLSLTLGAGLVAALTAALVPAARGAVVAAAALAVAGGVVAVVIALVTPVLLGMGDAKTVPAVLLVSGLLGWDVLLAGLLGVAIAGGVCGIVTLLRTRDARASFAFGPVLLAMPLLGLLLAPAVRTALGL